MDTYINLRILTQYPLLASSLASSCSSEIVEGEREKGIYLFIYLINMQQKAHTKKVTK